MIRRFLYPLFCTLILLLSPATTWAQLTPPCASSPNPPACTFEVIDVATNQPVTKLCVGRQVRFQKCAGRDLTLLSYYEVLPGVGMVACAFNGGPLYTPTAAGPITISENTQAPPAPSTLPQTVYFRNLEVYANPAPAFTLAPCTPGFALLTMPTAPYTRYSITIGGNVTPALPSQTLSLPVPAGVTSVTVTGIYDDNALCGNSATQPIAPLAAPGPLVIQQLALLGGTAQLTVAALVPGYRYTLERDAGTTGTFQPVTSAVQNGATSFSVPAAPAGRYRLRRTDDCQQAQATSDPLPTLTLTVTAAERRNVLAWQLLADPASYELTRNGTPLAVPVAGPVRTFVDTTVACGLRYTYRLTARYSASVTSVSDTVGVRATATQPPAAPRLFASFDLQNQVQLTAAVPRFPTSGQLTYLRGTQELSTTAARTLLDPTFARVALSETPCYTARFVDDCGNRSGAGPAFCPAILSAALADEPGNTIRLSWTPLRGAPAVTALDSLTYRLLVLAPDNSVLRTVPVGSRGPYLDLTPPANQQTVRYRLEVTGGGLPGPSYSNVARATRRLQVFVPTAFTPDGDGLNDVLEVKGRYLTTYQFVVVDRNGQEIFRGTDRTQTWDGRIRNEQPVPGAYVWRFEARDDNGQRIVQHGTVTILR